LVPLSLAAAPASHGPVTKATKWSRRAHVPRLADEQPPIRASPTAQTIFEDIGAPAIND
jgi:hypothetical protein